jgi:hypothetical protein
MFLSFGAIVSVSSSRVLMTKMLEDGPDLLSQNVSSKLHTDAMQHPRTSETSVALHISLKFHIVNAC